MSRKIGQALIEKGLITPAQLDEALRAQLIFGGHVGTCLLELGMIEEEPLGLALSEVLGVPYASAELLANVPEGVIHIVSRDIAEEYHVVPIRTEGRSLHLAMVDPANLYDVDEIAFATGRRIVRLVAPELRMFHALEKYYDVRRPLRHVRTVVLGGMPLDGPTVLPLPRAAAAVPVASGAEAEPAEFAQPEPAEPEPAEPWQETADRLLEPDDPPPPVESAGPVPASAWHAAPAHAPERDDAPPPPDVADGEPVAAAVDFVGPEARPAQAFAPTARVEAAPRPRPETIDELAELLGSATDGHALAEAVLGHVSHRTAHALLLGVQGAGLVGWGSWGFSPHATARFAPGQPVPAKWLLETLLGNQLYRGGLPEGSRPLDFYGWLGIEPPREILIAPIYLEERLIALFYVDWGARSGRFCDTADYVRMVRMLRHAMGRVILSRKIHTLARPGQASAV